MIRRHRRSPHTGRHLHTATSNSLNTLSYCLDCLDNRRMKQSGDENTSQHEWELPWAEPFAASSPERARLATQFGAAIRKTGSLMQLVGQAAADRIGINATDLNCLNILSFRGRLTAGELAKETGLTTASITGVVDRLEEA